MTTAERIKTARKEAGITQDELASKMFVTHHCISMWERGLRQPKYETLSRIADALGINVNRLLQTPMTNADRIRAMSDEELSEFMEELTYDVMEHNSRYLLEWLKQPVKEDA
jgi:transcriptional regulator with XRE-family HTH domain